MIWRFDLPGATPPAFAAVTLLFQSSLMQRSMICDVAFIFFRLLPDFFDSSLRRLFFFVISLAPLRCRRLRCHADILFRLRLRCYAALPL